MSVNARLVLEQGLVDARHVGRQRAVDERDALAWMTCRSIEPALHQFVFEDQVGSAKVGWQAAVKIKDNLLVTLQVLATVDIPSHLVGVPVLACARTFVLSFRAECEGEAQKYNRGLAFSTRSFPVYLSRVRGWGPSSYSLQIDLALTP